ncbi:MAG: hypothetical protein ACQKBY_12610 [Verrucomicrobiales bacterium]
MISWILIASYLWKDTWRRWFEQPGSILARSVVTIIMVALAVLLLVGFQMQIQKLRSQIESFGLDNLLLVETISPNDEAVAPEHRFGALAKHGHLITVKKLLVNGQSSDGNRASVVSYGDRDLRGLAPYLRYGHEVFLLSSRLKAGLVVDYEVEGKYYRGVTLEPDPDMAQLMQSDTLFIPRSQGEEYEERGYSMIYYLQRHPSAPDIKKITDAVNAVTRRDGFGRVELRSAVMLREKLNQLQSQQANLRFWMAALLGAALSLIYGTLSVLEFRQSMYVSALLRSFGAPRALLALRTVGENLLIVNAVALGVIWLLSQKHSLIFKSLRLSSTDDNLDQLYWGTETFWILAFANLGVLLSSLPVLFAMRKPVGKVLN